MRKDAFSGTVTSKIQKVDVGDGKRDLHKTQFCSETDIFLKFASIANYN
jgi:hypothetical protein